MSFATASFVLSISAVFGSAGVAAAGPADRPACTAATLTGAYGYLRQGHTTAGTFVSAVGLAEFDGQGRVTASEIISTNGGISHGSSDNAYLVDADCVVTFLDAAGARIRKAVIDHAGEGALGISTVNGTVERIDYARVAERDGADDVWRQRAQLEEHQTCTVATFKGTYAFERNGHTPTGDLVASGILFSDGQGTQSAQQTTSGSGVIRDPATQLATYTVAPDCTGAAIDPTGREFVAFVIVHGGSEVLAVGESGNNVAVRYERIFRPQQ